MTSYDDDAALMPRIAAGDGDALALLLDRHSSVVLGVLFRMLGARGEAEEVLQETFLQVWMQADRYEIGRSSPRGWILMLARSRALDRIRRRDSQRRRDEESGEEQVRMSPNSPVGTDRLEAAERRSQISSALGQLSPDQRSCIELAFFEGLTHTEIADRLAVPLGTIKTRIRAGLQRLRDVLRPHGEELLP